MAALTDPHEGFTVKDHQRLVLVLVEVEGSSVPGTCRPRRTVTTTVEEIAAAAEVSRPTVFSVGT